MLPALLTNGEACLNRAELIARSRRVVVKVGSGVLTAQGHGLDWDRVRLLAGQLARLAEGERQVLLVSSGAVASGRAKAGLPYDRELTLNEKQAVAALGQAGLMQAYEESFAEHGKKVAQVLLTAADLRSRTRFVNARSTLYTLLDWGVIPVVNENDTVSVAEIKLGDNDNLAAMLTNLLGAELMINLTNVDGILDADPRLNPQAQRIPVVEKVDAQLLQAASAQPGAVGLGGILSKVRAADKVARCGAHTIVANGLKDDILDRLQAGDDLGTLFLPRPTPLNSRKHWIAFAAAGGGEVVVDEGAVRPLVERGKSLLAAGVREVRGEFPEGSAVKVLGPGDCILGVGLSNYASRDLRQVMGLRSAEIAGRLGREQADEVIHRDNLVVFDLDEEESVACLLNS
ncbi:gamma-glutamyl kinase [Desulfocarbo indianensis]|nr:gamma-glutamyl kinase [Desulfocarbo indianensis]